MTTNPLLQLTPTQLHLLRGDRRSQLITYLKTWQENAILLRYLEGWLGAQPNLATLRQARAETLIALGQAEAALRELDALDKERGGSEGRRALRVAALAALGQWDDAHALLAAAPDADRQRGDLLLRQGKLDDARAVYVGSGFALHGPEAITTTAAEWAIALGDWNAASEILQRRYASQPDKEPRVGDLRLELRIAETLGDHVTSDRVLTALRDRQAAQTAALIDALDLPTHDELLDQADEPEDEPENPIGDEVDAPAEAIEFLHTHWGYTAFRGRQAAVVANMLAGQSTLAVLPTGAGKSLCYQLPAFLLSGATIVVSPLIALMKDQLDGLPAALRDKATAINSTLRADEVAERLREVRAGQFKLVYVAPERLRQQAFVQALRAAGVARFVVDEAHCVSLWGLSFRPDYLFLGRVLHELGEPPVLALTATATPDTQHEIVAQLGKLRVITASVFRSNLHFSVIPVANSEGKVDALIDKCKGTSGSIVVYARAREQCEKLAAALRGHGVKAAHYHAGIEDRATVQEAWMRGDTRVLVATIAFGMGVDKADVRMIVHYNLPQSVEAYYQEAGRAGRDGLPAECVLLYTANDKAQLTSWLRQDALGKDDLREVYRVLRANARHGFAAIHADALRDLLPRWSETQIRVMLGMLERVGLIVRHFDLPRSIMITLRDRALKPDLADFAAALDLKPDQRTTIDPLETAAMLGWRPDELERRLLGWHADGSMLVSGTATDLLLQLLPAPADAPDRIDALLADYATRQDARIASMVAYAKGLNCRHRALAAHFGQRLPACGGPCDVCSNTLPLIPAATIAPARPIAPMLHGPIVAEIILRTVRDLPFAVGRTGLAHVLVGSSQSSVTSDRCRDWGSLAAFSRKAVIAMIDTLTWQGLLQRDDGDRPLLHLTPQGRDALRTPDELLDLSPAPSSSPATDEADDELYRALERWRRDTAQAQSVPLYVVFANATLRDIAAARPDSIDALGRIKGVGPRKIEAWGVEVLAVVAGFVGVRQT